MGDVVLREESEGPEEGILRLTLNRPDQYNALSEEVLAALQAGLDEAAAREDLRVVVIAGRGRAFSAGHDLKEIQALPDEAACRALVDRCARLMLTIARLPQPVIARVHGVATAAGCQLVATCDLAVASEAARFATSGIGIGLFCSTPAVALSRNLARKHAFDLLATGRFVDATTARELGLVNRVVPADALDAAVDELARTLAGHSRHALASGKRMFYRQLGMDLEHAYAYASEVMARDMQSEDAVEGIAAFVEKRKPRWRDR